MGKFNGKFTKDLPAWGISLVVNLAILASMHFIVLRQSQPIEVNTIISDLNDTNELDDLYFANQSMEDQIGTDGSQLSLTPALSVSTPGQDTPLQEKVEEILNPEIPQLSEAALPKLEGDITSTVAIKGASDDAAGGVEGAMDRVTFEIQQSLKERRTLVIWLFDASGSLEARRAAIADRFDNIYKQLGRQGKTDGLYSLIAAYGEKSQILTPEPIQDVNQLSNVVRNDIKIDESGKENVFAALKLVLDKYRNWNRSQGKWNRLVFIVTDERGDDAELYLEDVITAAKRSQTKVYTIGNAAIFGQQKGYVRWTAPDGFTADIPVDQGPESAFPDGVQLPFIGSSSDWKLKQMSSSYGPYALTRVCAETGGLYLITEDSRGYNFERSVMRRYAPDYRPVRVQEQEILRNPAKAALVNVARMTYEDTLPTPVLEFRGYNDNILRSDLTEAQKPVAEVDVPLRRLYEALKIGEKARDTLREERWRAAFDLAMGRILAMRVRFAGYNMMLANMKVSPKPFSSDKHNMWRLVPSDKIESGPEMRKAAEAAKTYLKRVIDEHPGTPWALMAERELSTEMGWTWEEFGKPIPGSDQLRGTDEEVARLLLAEEERRKEESKKRRENSRRDLPKL